MADAIEYALLAGDSYYDTRAAINRLPIPSGWERISRFPTSDSGFEASAYTNGSEVVISYAGTYPTSGADWVANSTLASGVPGVDQLLQAAEYYLQVQAQYGNNISFEHSGTAHGFSRGDPVAYRHG